MTDSPKHCISSDVSVELIIAGSPRKKSFVSDVTLVSVKTAGIQDVIASISKELVVALATKELIISFEAVECVVSKVSPENVKPASAEHDLIVIIAFPSDTSS